MYLADANYAYIMLWVALFEQLCMIKLSYNSKLHESADCCSVSDGCEEFRDGELKQ